MSSLIEKLLINGSLGKEIIIYDLVNKYGDWLFKIPLALSFKKAGYLVRSAKENEFKKYKNILRSHRNNEHTSLAIVFTRSDKKISQSLLRKHPKVLELRRIKRSLEILIYWCKGRIIFQKRFSETHEQERIKSIVEFLGLRYIERRIRIRYPSNKKVAVNFSVSENSSQRLNLKRGEIAKTLHHIQRKGYKVVLIKKTGNQNSPIEKLIIKSFAGKVRISETNSLEEALAVVGSCSHYFGVDCGLAHHAAERGKIVFVLFNKKYHGSSPLFNSNFINYLSFFGDTNFSKKLIEYFDNLENPDRRTNLSSLFLKSLLLGTCPMQRNSYANSQKIFHLVLKLSFLDPRVKKTFDSIRNLPRDIFFIDRFYKADYSTLQEAKGKAFIESRKFATFLK